MSDLRGAVPVEFYNLKKAKKPHHPIATNVEQLIRQLQRLPPGLPVDSGWGCGVELVVYNMDASFGDTHLQLQHLNE